MRTALAFLTPLPVGARPPTARTLAWFPLAGAVIGALVGAAWWGAGEVFPPVVAAALAVAFDIALTGALHLDGVADTCDGLLAHHDDTDRRMEVMAAPDVGAFGMAAVAAIVPMRIAALAALDPDVALVAAVWCAARSAMAAALVVGPYVGGGMGTAFAGASLGWPVAGLAAAAIGGALAGEPAAVPALALAALAVLALARRRLGGVTGDVLGAAGVVGETVALVVATAML